MDTTKVGLATAKAMEEIERLVRNGAIENAETAYVGAVVIVVAIDSPTADDVPNREELRDVTTQVFCFSEPDQLYVQVGMLEMAKENYGPGSWD